MRRIHYPQIPSQWELPLTYVSRCCWHIEQTFGILIWLRNISRKYNRNMETSFLCNIEYCIAECRVRHNLGYLQSCKVMKYLCIQFLSWTEVRNRCKVITSSKNCRLPDMESLKLFSKGSPAIKKTVKKGDIVPFRRPPPP